MLRGGLGLGIARPLREESTLNRLPILQTNPNDQSAYNLLILNDSIFLGRGLRGSGVRRAAEKIRP